MAWKFLEAADIAIYLISSFAREYTESEYITESDIFGKTAELGAPPYLMSIVDHLIAQRMIRQTSAAEDIEYVVEPRAFHYVEEQLENRNSSIFQYVNNSADLSSPTPLRYKSFRDALTIALYDVSNERGLELYNLRDLADEKKIPYRDGWISEFTDFLAEHRYAVVTKAFGGDKTCGAKLRAPGLEHAEELLENSGVHPNRDDDPTTLVIETETEAASTLDESGQNDTAGNDHGLVAIPAEIPASDRYVELDHNSAAYREAVEALDRVIEEVRSDNAYGDEAPEEKEQIVAALQAGRNLLNATKVRVAAGWALLMPALKYLADNWAKGTIAAVAAAALAKLLGLGS